MKFIGVGHVKIDGQARENIADVLDSGWLSYGQYTKQFEKEFAKAHSHQFGVFVNSGTSALQIGLAALKERYGWQDGDEVLVPALTFVASVNTILQNGLRPVFVDIGLDDYEMDLTPERAGFYSNNPKLKAMMPVHLFGQPVKPSNYDFARTYGLKVIDDSCETMFVKDESGNIAGSQADVACYSTYACHILVTGVGGFALCSDPSLAPLIRSYANHGRDGIYFEEASLEEKISKRFSFERIGYSYRATELEAAIGVAQLRTRLTNIAQRNANARQLTDALATLPLRLPRIRQGSEHAWMMYPILARDSAERAALELHLEKRLIETRRMLPLTNQPVYKKLFGDNLEDRFPNAKIVNARGFYVGCHDGLNEEDIARMGRAFWEFFEG